MTHPTRPQAFALLIVAVCLVAVNMRPTLTSVGPLLDQISDDTGLGTTALGLITTVPLLIWALVSSSASRLARRFGMARVVLGSLGILLIGTLVRSIPGPTVSLWIGTVIIGLALAMMNVLMPALIKREFAPRIAVVMALYTGLLSGFGALGTGLAVPLSGSDSQWRLSLLIIGAALLPPAIIVWAVATRSSDARSRTAEESPPRHTGIWRDAVAWQVAVYMGLQSATFYMLVTWLPQIATSTGRSETEAGFDTMLYQLASIVGSVTLPLLLRGTLRRAVPSLLPVVGAIGVIGLLVAPQGILVWAILLGLFGGASLSMALTLMAERARDHHTSSALSGMSQSVGYAIAAFGPVAFGALHDLTGNWTASLVLTGACMVGIVFVGVFAGRDRFVLDRH